MSSHKKESRSDDLCSPLLPPVMVDGQPPLEMLSVDQALTKYCGEFGFWQLKHFVLTCMAWALEAIHTMVMVFADREPGWTCEPGSECVLNSNESVCGLQPGSWRWDGSEGWSTVAEWGLVCGQKYKVGLVQALFFSGCMIDNTLPISLNKCTWNTSTFYDEMVILMLEPTLTRARVKQNTELIFDSFPTQVDSWHYGLAF
ncbi:hypothetical protein Hdeb2414_s0003g00091021 [Helianthus debilis subsp. tardiflorus]